MQKLYLMILFVLVFSLIACGAGGDVSPSIEVPVSHGNRDDNARPAVSDMETNFAKVNLPSGTLEITMPDKTAVRIPITKCGGNSTMLDIQEFTKTAPGQLSIYGCCYHVSQRRRGNE